MASIVNNKIVAYVNEVCSRIKFREAHREIKLELTAHLQDTVADYVSEGFSEDEAVSKAIAQMGSADSVGKQFNKVHKPRPEWSILSISLLFVSLGLLATFFIEQQGLLGYTSGPISMVTKGLVFTFLGVVLITCLYLFNFRRIKPYSKHIYWITLSLLVVSLIAGQPVNGTTYLSIGPVALNFVDVSPLLLCIALAGILSKWDWNRPKRLLQSLFLCAAPLVLILACRSLTAAIIYTVVCITLAIASGAKPRAFLTLAIIISGLVIHSIFSIQYTWQRFITFFLNPSQDPQGTGWLNMQLNQLISKSGFIGQGLTQKPEFIPDPHTDFIFTYVTYTFGWLAGCVLIALIVLFTIRMAKVAAVVKSNYARLLISGFTAIFAVQFLWNISMNLGLVPISGVGLPFISYGGSQLIFNAAALGVTSSIYRRRNISPCLIDNK